MIQAFYAFLLQVEFQRLVENGANCVLNSLRVVGNLGLSAMKIIDLKNGIYQDKSQRSNYSLVWKGELKGAA